MAEPHHTPPWRTAISTALVGRHAELAQFEDALDGATGGSGSVMFLVGEAGIGKSRLARALATRADGLGIPVLSGRAVQGPAPAAYRPLAEALSSAVRAGAGPDAARMGPFRSTLARLIPAWRGDDHETLDESLVGLAEAVLRFLSATAGGQGVLLVLEDLHWADPETLTIVDYLADNVVTERILCVATLRDQGSSPGVQLARSLQARRVSEAIELTPLDEQYVATMVASCLRSSTVPDAVVALAARADGVPFMVEELLATALSSGALVEEAGSWRVRKSLETVVPLTLAENMRRRLGQLNRHCQDVLVAAAVLGRRFSWELLPAITGLNGEVVLAALHDAVDAQIVSFDREEGSFRFRHALSREAVLAGLFPAEVQALSRRALDAVESAHPELEEVWAELAARLAITAGDGERAAALLLEVGRRAVEQGALASAEATLERARRLLTRDDSTSLDVDECLLQVLSLAGNRQRAVEVAASLLARLGGEPRWARRRVEIHLRLARAAVAATQWEEAHAILERALAETVGEPDEELMARLDAVRAQAAIVRDPEQARALARAALDRAERLGLAEVACEALEVIGRSERLGDPAAAEAAFTRALTLADAHGLTVWRARALQELGAIDMLCGRPLDRLEKARELALARGALATAAVVDVQMAAGLSIGDDPEATVVAARRSAELSRRYHLDHTLAAALALEGYAHARARRHAEMQRCIDEARALAHGAPDTMVKTSTVAALLALVEEDRARARRHLCAGLRTVALAGTDYSVHPATGLLALLRQLDGPDDDAPEVVVPERSVHFLTSAFLRFARAVAEGRQGDAGAATALLADAERALGGHRWFRHLGLRLVAEAAVADRWGDPVPWLREALDFFDGRGDDRIASACRSLLRKAGAPVPRRRGDTDVPGELRALGVTSRELEVLRLLAVGLPNKEIAARLYLSPRTVERHLENLSVKTGATRRSELVAYAARTVGPVSQP
ncbi:MAG: AAA family ATPase [Actinomycetota bacterium]|nr:AAA family ATPase [Actinomycetota bacterium]